MIYFLSFFSFAIGIACGIVPNTLLGIELALLFPLILILLGGWKRGYIVLITITAGLIGWYLGYSDSLLREESYTILTKETNTFSGTYTITGKVEKILYRGDLTNTYRLQIDIIANTSTKNTISLHNKNIGIFLEVPNNLRINTGDIIEYRGKIMKVLDFPLKGFSRYAWYHQVYGKSVVPIFKRVTINNPSIIDGLQHWAKSVIFRGFPENISGIILGMTIGNTELLSSETKKSFTNAGITHILVVSGSNIAFVIIIITGILRYIPMKRWLQATIVITFVCIYGSLVGWDIPVIRAVAMGLITYIVIEGGKRSSSIAILFLVGWGILIYSPLALMYDAGFGLSFAGTLGILLFYRSIGSLLRYRYIPDFMRDIISVTIAASIGSMIAIIYHFGTIPIYTLLSNILISGVLGWILFSSVLYLLLALIGGWILYIWGWTIYLPTAYIMWIGDFFGNGYIYTLHETWIEPITLFLIGIMMTLVLLIEIRKILQSK